LAAPKDDLISKLAVEQLKPGHIQHSDAVQIAFLLLVAGNATMVNMISLASHPPSPPKKKKPALQSPAFPRLSRNKYLITMRRQGVIELARNPKQLDELKANPSLATAFVEELCRYHTGSSMAMKRVAKEDVNIGGKVLHTS
jgi:fungal nitric oxide reductase